MSELLIGCGYSRKKRVSVPGRSADWDGLVTLDMDSACEPDVVHDLNILPYPFPDDTFDEIHGYQTLEHLGRQGDWKFFFAQFEEFHRILKPGGIFIASVPTWDSQWAWADPGHTRIITRMTLVFLDQREYAQLGNTSMTDYRPWYKADFEVAFAEERPNGPDEYQLWFALRAIKGDVKHSAYPEKE